MDKSVRTTKIREARGSKVPTTPRPQKFVAERFACVSCSNPPRYAQFDDLAQAQAWVDADAAAGLNSAAYELFGWGCRLVYQAGK